MRAALLAVALAVASCSPGQYAPPPPARFHGDRTVAVAFVQDVDAACVARGHARPEGTHITGCFDRGVAFLPNPCAWPNDSDFRQLACHELGHANGWPANHPN